MNLACSRLVKNLDWRRPKSSHSAYGFTYALFLSVPIPPCTASLLTNCSIFLPAPQAEIARGSWALKARCAEEVDTVRHSRLDGLKNGPLRDTWDVGKFNALAAGPAPAGLIVYEELWGTENSWSVRSVRSVRKCAPLFSPVAGWSPPGTVTSGSRVKEGEGDDQNCSAANARAAGAQKP